MQIYTKSEHDELERRKKDRAEAADLIDGMVEVVAGVVKDPDDDETRILAELGFLGGQITRIHRARAAERDSSESAEHEQKTLPLKVSADARRRSFTFGTRAECAFPSVSPYVTHASVNVRFGQTQCVLCLTDFEAATVLIKIECGHVFCFTVRLLVSSSSSSLPTVRTEVARGGHDLPVMQVRPEIGRGILFARRSAAVLSAVELRGLR